MIVPVVTVIWNWASEWVISRTWINLTTAAHLNGYSGQIVAPLSNGRFVFRVCPEFIEEYVTVRVRPEILFHN